MPVELLNPKTWFGQGVDTSVPSVFSDNTTQGQGGFDVDAEEERKRKEEEERLRKIAEAQAKLAAAKTQEEAQAILGGYTDIADALTLPDLPAQAKLDEQIQPPPTQAPPQDANIPYTQQQVLDLQAQQNIPEWQKQYNVQNQLKEQWSQIATSSERFWERLSKDTYPVTDDMITDSPLSLKIGGMLVQATSEQEMSDFLRFITDNRGYLFTGGTPLGGTGTISTEQFKLSVANEKVLNTPERQAYQYWQSRERLAEAYDNNVNELAKRLNVEPEELFNAQGEPSLPANLTGVSAAYADRIKRQYGRYNVNVEEIPGKVEQAYRAYATDANHKLPEGWNLNPEKQQEFTLPNGWNIYHGDANTPAYYKDETGHNYTTQEVIENLDLMKRFGEAITPQMVDQFKQEIKNQPDVVEHLITRIGYAPEIKALLDKTYPELAKNGTIDEYLKVIQKQQESPKAIAQPKTQEALSKQRIIMAEAANIFKQEKTTEGDVRLDQLYEEWKAIGGSEILISWALSPAMPKPLVGPTPKAARDILYTKAGRQIFSGFGGAMQSIGGMLRWKLPGEMAEVISETGVDIQNLGKHINWTYDLRDSSTWKNPSFYQDTALMTAAQVPTMVGFAIIGYTTAMLSPAIGAVGVSVGLGSFATMLLSQGLGAAIGGTLNRGIESTMEAGDAYNQAKARGFNDDKANMVAESVFDGNMKLVGMDITELGVGLAAGGKGKAVSKTLRALMNVGIVGGKMSFIGLSNAGEERYQTYLQMMALGDTVDFWNPDNLELQQASFLGGILGVAQGGGLHAASILSQKITNNLPPSIQTEVNTRADELVKNGETEERAFMMAMEEAVEGHPESLNEIQTSVTDAIDETKQQIIAEEYQASQDRISETEGVKEKPTEATTTPPVEAQAAQKASTHWEKGVGIVDGSGMPLSGAEILDNLAETWRINRINKIANQEFLRDNIYPAFREKFGVAPVMDIVKRGDKYYLAISTAGWEQRAESLGLKFVKESGFDNLYDFMSGVDTVKYPLALPNKAQVAQKAGEAVKPIATAVEGAAKITPINKKVADLIKGREGIPVTINDDYPIQHLNKGDKVTAYPTGKEVNGIKQYDILTPDGLLSTNVSEVVFEGTAKIPEVMPKITSAKMAEIDVKLADVKTRIKAAADKGIFERGAINDPEVRQAYKDLAEAAGLYVQKGVLTVEEFARELGIKINDLVQRAWDEASEVAGKGEVPEGKGISKFAQRVEEKYGVTFPEESKLYDKITLKGVIGKASEVAQANINDAVAISMGFKKAPMGTNQNAVSIAAIEYMAQHGEGAKLQQLATSTSRRGTIAAQSLVTLRTLNENDPINFIKQTIQDRTEQVGRKIKEKGTPSAKVATKMKTMVDEVKTTLSLKQIKIAKAEEIINSLIC